MQTILLLNVIPSKELLASVKPVGFNMLLPVDTIVPFAKLVSILSVKQILS